MTLEEKKQAVIEEFSMYDEWLDKYEYLIELGKALEAYPEEGREAVFPGRQRRHHHQGHHFAADQRLFRTYPGGDCGR